MSKKLPELKQVTIKDLLEVLSRIEAFTHTAEDALLVRQVFESYILLSQHKDRKEADIKALLRRIMGIKSEKTKKVREKVISQPQPQSEGDTSKEKNRQTDVSLKRHTNRLESEAKKPKAKGHGRNGADDYTGAERIFVSHPELCSGDKCPECLKGRVYPLKQPGVFIHITGSSPLQATVFELEKLRCNLCGEIFQARPPEEVSAKATGSRHYDETAKSMMTLLRYGAGLPMYRLGQLQSRLGMPLPVSTQWDKIREFGDQLTPLHHEYIHQAAQGKLFYHDDTGMKVLSLIKEINEEQKVQKGKGRTGIFTSGIISETGGRKIALYFSGRKHAGENMTDLLENRIEGLDPPIQMSDAKSGNTPENIEVIESNCNTHARRYFVNVAEDFPNECLYVISEVFGQIYHHDALAKQQGLSPKKRLRFHQKKSGPIMEEFYAWLQKQFDQKLVEPNSSLGKAIQYTLNHFKKLTRFLQVEGAPLDNNICERMLKQAILHRKNSLFYKTERGARLGDLFMSLIHTCHLAGENPFAYLTQLQIHKTRVSDAPNQWFPWNFRETIRYLPQAKSA